MLCHIRSGAASKSLVLYCNYAHNQAENYSPYDLVVVGMQRAEVRPHPRSLDIHQLSLLEVLLLACKVGRGGEGGRHPSPGHLPHDVACCTDVLYSCCHQPEHFAISFGGVTHIRPGCDTEVTPLHEWTREKQLYSTVKRLPFFGKHALAKVSTRCKTIRQSRA